MIKDYLTQIFGETQSLGNGPEKQAYKDYVVRVVDSKHPWCFPVFCK